MIQFRVCVVKDKDKPSNHGFLVFVKLKKVGEVKLIISKQWLEDKKKGITQHLILVTLAYAFLKLIHISPICPEDEIMHLSILKMSLLKA